MTDSLEHDSNEEAEATEGKPLPLPKEPHKRAMEREDIKAARGREEQPWNSPGNPAVWKMLVGEPFDDDDCEERKDAERYRNLAT